MTFCLFTNVLWTNYWREGIVDCSALLYLYFITLTAIEYPIDQLPSFQKIDFWLCVGNVKIYSAVFDKTKLKRYAKKNSEFLEQLKCIHHMILIFRQKLLYITIEFLLILHIIFEFVHKFFLSQEKHTLSWEVQIVSRCSVHIKFVLYKYNLIT